MKNTCFFIITFSEWIMSHKGTYLVSTWNDTQLHTTEACKTKSQDNLHAFCFNILQLTAGCYSVDLNKVLQVASFNSHLKTRCSFHTEVLLVKQKTQQAESFFSHYCKCITTVQLIFEPAPQVKNCTGFALVYESKNHMNKQQWQRRLHACYTCYQPFTKSLSTRWHNCNMNAIIFTSATTFKFAICDALLLEDNSFLPFINTAFMHSLPPQINNNKKQATVDTTYPNLQCYFSMLYSNI